MSNVDNLSRVFKISWWNWFFIVFLVIVIHLPSAMAGAETIHLPKEVVRHIYKNIRRFNRNDNKAEVIQDAHMAIPSSVVTVTERKGQIFYFTVDLVRLMPNDSLASRMAEIHVVNNHRTDGFNSKTLKKKHAFLWIVSPGSRGGRGLMWRSCKLKRRKYHKRGQNSKQRWVTYRAVEPTCVENLMKSAVRGRQSNVVFAAVSQVRPSVSARIAKKGLPRMMSHRPKKRLIILLSSYFRSNATESPGDADHVTDQSIPATVSTDYAVNFLLSHFLQPKRRNVRSAKVDMHHRLSPSVPNLCKRQKLIVKVEDVGLQDYIIYPREFDIGQCSGECVFPLISEVNPRAHSVVQMLHHLIHPDRIPAPGCVPVSFKPTTVLVQKTDSTLMTQTFNDLIVASCGCR